MYEGASAELAFKLLVRNGGAEDFSAMARLAWNKRWATSRHNGELCKACGIVVNGQRHPLMICQNAEVIESRNEWKKKVEIEINRTANIKMKGILHEIWHHMQHTVGGDMACVGTFREDWTSHIGHYGYLTDEEIKKNNEDTEGGS